MKLELLSKTITFIYFKVIFYSEYYYCILLLLLLIILRWTVEEYKL
jgi:hypothetical protein